MHKYVEARLWRNVERALEYILCAAATSATTIIINISASLSIYPCCWRRERRTKTGTNIARIAGNSERKRNEVQATTTIGVHRLGWNRYLSTMHHTHTHISACARALHKRREYALALTLMHCDIEFFIWKWILFSLVPMPILGACICITALAWLAGW